MAKLKYIKITNFKEPHKKLFGKLWIHVPTREQSLRVQEFCFAKGYGWAIHDKRIRNLDQPYIAIYPEEKGIYHSNRVDGSGKLVTLAQLKKML